MADSTLAAIRTKVRRLTHSPSSTLITDGQIDEYVNTFVLYDVPESVRLFALRTNLTFYTQPNIDTYETNATVGDPLEDFENRYITVHDPVYIAGYPAFFSQSQSEFYGLYPLTNSISSTGDTGDGATVAFSGTLSDIPIVPNYVTFVSKDASNNGLRLSDDGAGVLSGDGSGTINYVTGAYSLTFSTAPASGEIIYSETRPYVAARPRALLYFDNKFIVRPVPDKVYPIQIEAYIRPTELLSAGQSPDLEQWWQYIAYGAAKKIFEDKMDMDSVAKIMPEFKQQERLVLRRTIVQQTNERVATIYSQQSGIGGNFPWWGNGTN